MSSLTDEQRRALGHERISTWIDADTARALAFLADLDADERGLPAERCRTYSLSVAVKQRALRAGLEDGDRVRGKRAKRWAYKKST